MNYLFRSVINNKKVSQIIRQFLERSSADNLYSVFSRNLGRYFWMKTIRKWIIWLFRYILTRRNMGFPCKQMCLFWSCLWILSDIFRGNFPRAHIVYKTSCLFIGLCQLLFQLIQFQSNLSFGEKYLVHILSTELFVFLLACTSYFFKGISNSKIEDRLPYIQEVSLSVLKTIFM